LQRRGRSFGQVSRNNNVADGEHGPTSQGQKKNGWMSSTVIHTAESGRADWAASMLGRADLICIKAPRRAA
jgi:hypothetical protein